MLELDALQTRVVAANSTVCFDIPMEISCTNVVIVFPGNCLCPLQNSSRGRSLFLQCACLDTSGLAPELADNGSICFQVSPNDTLIRYLCSAQQQECGQNQCFLRTILESHRIIIPGTVLVSMCKWKWVPLCYNMHLAALSHPSYINIIV